MALFIHHKKKFNKKMKRLRKGGGKASLAVNRAEEIIKRLSVRKRIGVEDIRKLTKYGEFRFDNVLKYDLGGGYRLICVKQEKHIIISYIGSHDDCNRWLENNRGFRTAFDEESQKIVFEKESEREIRSSEDELGLEIDYDDILIKKMDEKALRIVFNGLCEK
jgi:hypothetical protein